MANHSRSLAGIILLFIIVIGDIITGAVSSDVTINTSLGVWANMPSATTELMGNTSYRGQLRVANGGVAGFAVALVVGCINPSNHAGATLQLQYANESSITPNINSSNYVNIGAAVKIDNSANWPCPGILTALSGSLPAYRNGLNNIAFLFRVLGSGGGGSGDNPRFSTIAVNVLQEVNKTPLIVIPTISTTSFTANIQTTWFLAVSTTVNYDWIALNSTLLSQMETGTGSCTITVTVAPGSGSCSSTITFVNAFLNTPIVVATPTSGNLLTLTYTGTIELLMAQTVTV